MVYLCQIPFSCDKGISSNKRREMIENTKNEQLKLQKFYAWKLLERAIEWHLGIEPKTVDFQECDGVFFAKDFYFSITHCSNVCAVAVSRLKPVGIDLEIIDEKRWSKPYFSSILSPLEKTTFTNLTPSLLTALWTKKESIYKKEWKIGDKTPFVPQKTCTVNAKTVTKEVFYENSAFFISVCTDSKNICFFALENTRISQSNFRIKKQFYTTKSQS